MKKQRDHAHVSLETVFTIYRYTILISLPGPLKRSHVLSEALRKGSFSRWSSQQCNMVLMIPLMCIVSVAEVLCVACGRFWQENDSRGLWPWPLSRKYSLFENPLSTCCWAMDTELPWTSSCSSRSLSSTWTWSWVSSNRNDLYKVMFEQILETPAAHSTHTPTSGALLLPSLWPDELCPDSCGGKTSTLVCSRLYLIRRH